MNTKTLTRTTTAAARELYLAGRIPAVDNIPCVCDAPRNVHAGPTHAGGFDVTGCTRYREHKMLGLVARAHHARDHGFDESMAAYDAMTRKGGRKKKAGQVSVRPSDLYGCRKQIEYRERPPEDYVPEETDQRQAWMGGLIHDELGRRRAALYPWRMYEAEVHMPGSDRPYRFDEYDPITGVLYEIKTAGEWRWEKVGQQGVDDKWLGQAMLYAWALIQKGYPVEKVVLLVLHREKGWSEPFEFDYDEAIAQKALDWIAKVALQIDLGLLDDEPNGGRDESGPSTSTMCAKLCPARRHCWNMDVPGPVSLGRSPENLTLLGLSPDEAEVEEKLSDLVALRESRLAIEAQEKAMRALLDGVDLREYGDYKPTTKPTKGTAWKQYQELVEAYWNDPERPDEAPKPPTSTGSSTTWSRIRQAEKDKREKARKKALAAAEKALSAPEPAPETPLLHVVAERVEETPEGPLALPPAAEAS